MPGNDSQLDYRLMFAVPALNESSSVASVIQDLKAEFPEAEVLVVDDGSTDQTAKVARQAGARVVVLPFNVGVGGAMRTAFLHAQRQGIDVVVQVDADGQHSAKYVGDLLAGLESADLVIGSRFAGTGDYRMRGPRRWASRLLSRGLSYRVGVKLTDVTSGFRATGPQAIPLFARHYPVEYLGDTVDSLVMAHQAGLGISEVPVEMSPRQEGEPSQGVVRSVLYLGRSLMALLVAASHRNSYQEKG